MAQEGKLTIIKPRPQKWVKTALEKNKPKPVLRLTHYYLDISFEIDYLNGPDNRGDFQRVWNKHVALNRIETILLRE